MQLFVVATPIGNLDDITFRAVKILRDVDFLIAEDTRRAAILLQKFKIDKKIISFHCRSSDRKIVEICEKIRAAKNGAALISDAGTPGISDPGFKILKYAAQKKILISPLPGASALTALISVAAAPTDKFIFFGFLPQKKGRQKIFAQIVDSKISAIFFESVHRFPKFLNEAEKIFGADRKIVVGRELTKMHEEIFRGEIAVAKKFFFAEKIRGEFVILVAPKNFNF